MAHGSAGSGSTVMSSTAPSVSAFLILTPATLTWRDLYHLDCQIPCSVFTRAVKASQTRMQSFASNLVRSSRGHSRDNESEH
ncbi:hypothetical protein DAEQUDRAFT_726634 [Daedalea quercina L-15889]|uniref:Uncharacterized protein n=1 Tax=Daedalea quercina L-15889 TaxID=1314783 RepID=A0A165QEL7_9APHY|nr:hypothetical protein DAEQUDRAFT_726634 [Daedalea quercina L-15889]